MTSTRDKRPRRMRLLLAALACASLGFEGDFAGCGGPGAPPSGPVPEGPGVACLVDTDCAEVMCQQVRCIANRCVAGDAPPVDRDGDGSSPPPCGNDCDDATPMRAPGNIEVCDLADNDCDGRVDEGAAPSFLVGQLSVEALASAPTLIDGVPGVLFLSSAGGRSLEARWLATESTRVGIANIVDGPVGLAAARSLGGGRVEILFTRQTSLISLERTTLRVTLGVSVSITIERTETVMTLPSLPTALQMESDARGAAILVAAEPTLLLLPDLAPIPVPTGVFDLALAGDTVAIPGMTPGSVDHYDRITGMLRGSSDLAEPLNLTDAIVAWGPRLFAIHGSTLSELDTVRFGTITAVSLPPESISEFPRETFWGATSSELVLVDSDQRVFGYGEMLGLRSHATLAVIGNRNQIFELDTRLLVVSTSRTNTTYQVEQCGN